MRQRLGDEDFAPIGVVVQDAQGELPGPEDAALWQDALGLGFPVVADVDGSFFATWDPKGWLPMTYVLDAEGVIRWTEAGGTAKLEEIEAEVLDAME